MEGAQNQHTLTGSMEPYNHRESDDDSTDEKDSFLYARTQSLRKQNRSYKTVGLILGLTISSLLIATVFVVRHLRTTNSDPEKHNGQWTNCGLTIDDALSRDCKFDMMGNNWVPPLCHDAAFAKSAATGNNSIASSFRVSEFQWYEKPFRNDHVEDLELYLIGKARRGEELTAYTTESWHVAHCMYWLSVGVNAMDRLNRGERDVWVPRVVKKPTHARHCTDLTGFDISRDHTKDKEEITPMVYFGYATCVPLA